MQIKSHVLTSPQPGLRADSARQHAARLNIGAIGMASKGEAVDDGRVTVEGDQLVISFPQGTDVSGKADKVRNAVDGHFAGLDSNGNLTDSGKSPLDFTKVEPSATNGNIVIDGDEAAVYTHPTGTSVQAAAVKVGSDGLGHVVIGDALSKADLGLDQVDNTADADKPISTATQAALDGKAAQADTLAGYGITDAYTKSEVYAKDEVYTKTEIDSTYAAKADVYTKNEVYPKTDVYTKDEVYPKTDVYTKNEVYPKSDVYTKNEVYNKSEVYAKDEVYTKTEIGSTYAVKSEMAVTDVSGDTTKKTIQLKAGVSQDVVVDISGKQDALPASTANKFLATDANNALTWKSVDAELPESTASDAGKLLAVDSNGAPEWASMDISVWGTVITDGENDLTDESGNHILDDNVVELLTSYNGTGFGAERALADIAGRSLELSVQNDKIVAIGGKSLSVVELPEITPADEGKVLMVVNGVPKWTSLH